MKTHTFKSIRWLGAPGDQRRYAVVEVDRDGPVLRAGPYPPDQADRVVRSLARTSRRESRGYRREELP